MKNFLAFKSAPAYGQHKVQDGGVAGTELATSPDELAEGAIGIFAISNSGKLVLVDANADFLDVKEFIVARGLAEGCLITDTIERSSLKVEKGAAAAGVKKVVTLSAIPANLPANSLVEVGITNNNTRLEIEKRTKRSSYITKAANESAATIAAALVASINKKNFMVDASVSGSNIVLTAKEAGKNFHAFVDEALSATITVTTKPVIAEGDVATLQKLETDCIAYAGKTRMDDLELGDTKPYSTIDTSEDSFVLYNIAWLGTTIRTAVATDAVALRPKRLYLAIPTGASAIATVDGLLTGAALEEVAAQAEEDGV